MEEGLDGIISKLGGGLNDNSESDAFESGLKYLPHPPSSFLSREEPPTLIAAAWLWLFRPIIPATIFLSDVKQHIPEKEEQRQRIFPAAIYFRVSSCSDPGDLRPPVISLTPAT